jgi:hypothetical protein
LITMKQLSKILVAPNRFQNIEEYVNDSVNN